MSGGFLRANRKPMKRYVRLVTNLPQLDVVRVLARERSEFQVDCVGPGCRTGTQDESNERQNQRSSNESPPDSSPLHPISADIHRFAPAGIELRASKDTELPAGEPGGGVPTIGPATKRPFILSIESVSRGCVTSDGSAGSDRAEPRTIVSPGAQSWGVVPADGTSPRSCT